ncbi:hypothetical protein HanIR_Chr17g0872501 [Helianthus annuus]|nr:hypothetical protein HanIR_Chr17g0872501 [Helianthus annuus]
MSFIMFRSLVPGPICIDKHVKLVTSNIFLSQVIFKMINQNGIQTFLKRYSKCVGLLYLPAKADIFSKN